VKGKIVVNRDLCKECLLCIEFCRKGCIEAGREYNSRGYRPVTAIEEKECNGCALCALMCPEVAIEVYRDE
jgi:2-oxoglutarate ferredoxin oxidoreductase subunit delta